MTRRDASARLHTRDSHRIEFSSTKRWTIHDIARRSIPRSRRHANKTRATIASVVIDSKRSAGIRTRFRHVREVTFRHEVAFARAAGQTARHEDHPRLLGTRDRPRMLSALIFARETRSQREKSPRMMRRFMHQKERRELTWPRMPAPHSGKKVDFFGQIRLQTSILNES